MNKKIGIIGCGNMGQAICERLKDSFVISVYDKDKSKTEKCIGVKIVTEAASLVNESDAVILAVKPQDFDSLLLEIKDSVHDKLIVTIAAGITTDYIEKQLVGAKVVRVMPNMPAKIGKGMSCLCKGKIATNEDLKFAQNLFEKLGRTLILDEDMMDAATAISGSGPGYLYDLVQDKSLVEIEKFTRKKFIPELSDTAMSIGFTSEQAKTLAQATSEGSVALLKKTKLSASDLKSQIASKGGTTQAGLEVLHKGGSLKEAVQAALKRAKELARR